MEIANFNLSFQTIIPLYILAFFETDVAQYE